MFMGDEEAPHPCGKRGFMIHPGGDLLSQDLSSNYHRRYSVSLPGSERDRVVPLCSGHRASDRPSFWRVLVSPGLSACPLTFFFFLGRDVREGWGYS